MDWVIGILLDVVLVVILLLCIRKGKPIPERMMNR